MTRVTVRSGDFILGDVDGVIANPQDVAASEVLTAQEINIRAELGKGLPLSEALARFGHV